LGTLIHPNLFQPFCECLGTFSNLISSFSAFFILFFYPPMSIKHIDEIKRMTRNKKGRKNLQ
jgi:hypothetical protein